MKKSIASLPTGKLYIRIFDAICEDDMLLVACQDMNFTYGDAIKAINHDNSVMVRAKMFCNLIIHRMGIEHNIDDYAVEGDYNPMMDQILTVFMLAWMDIEMEANYIPEAYTS